MKVTVVTTFSKEGYACYGRRFIESFLKHEKEAKLVVYHESLPSVDFLADNLEWRNLDRRSWYREQFLAKHGKDPEKIGTWKDPNSQAIRFCHKVFAVRDAIGSCSNEDWLVWMDADVVITNKPDWKRALPDGALLSFLGRPHYKYTECGFVGYRASDARVVDLIGDMAEYFHSGEIFTRPKSDWHDSRCFDICRLRSAVPLNKQHSLSHLTPHQVHVWPYTVLANWSTHQKGPMRKKQVYGSIVP